MKNVINWKTAILLICLFLIVTTGIYKMTGNVTQSDEMKVKLKTNMGDIVIELYSEMPITTQNFKSLAEKGIYDGVIFHRVID